MKVSDQNFNKYSVCPDCLGRGKKSRRLSKKVRLKFQLDLEKFEQSNGDLPEPKRPKASLYICENCNGSGIIPADDFPNPDLQNFPHIAIVGGGIGGVALAVACLHRGIPFTLYERDKSFSDRSQGYGLTLQQASTAISSFGITKLKEGIISTRHVVLNPAGKIIGEWGMRKWLESENSKLANRTNVHISRQSLRLELMNQLGDSKNIKWNHHLININENKGGKIDLNFQVDGEIVKATADLVVGADGIRSVIRNFINEEKKLPLRYLGCIVILGICPLSALEGLNSDLLDSATVFQTANGNERIYMMPFNADLIMWQLSFPMLEEEAITLSARGKEALKEEAILKTPWHTPIPEILEATSAADISGYPVYDRDLINPEFFKNAGNVTLIGDAAHPMSPFKGQGANQALLDALSLAKEIYKIRNPNTSWKELNLRDSVLNNYESEMIERTASKVKDSAEAVALLHSDEVLRESNEPRGRHIKK